ncbi:hypothetical protein [Pengzhenrongella sp.]|jgi:hypothetical protein|uniref:hypothetical protein n=1 Tax=Pengzhenrongella sp. TaxID=2888820 RepID=UPI002F92F8CF
MTTKAQQWWESLTPATRAKLHADPRGPVPGEVWAEISRNGGSDLGTYWTSIQAAPDGFYLPHDLAEHAGRSTTVEL